MYLKPLYIIVVLIVAGCTMQSCTSYDWDAPVLGSEVTFEVADLSRASAISSINCEGSKFAVFSDMRYMNYDHLLTVFDGDIVTYLNGKWTYTNTQYWFPNHEHSFIALHPVDVTELSGTTYSDSRLTFTYTLPKDFQSAQDLLVATHRRMYQEDPQSRAEPATLRFRHILSRINFNVKNEGAADKVKVTKIVLEGINKKGTFSIIPAPILSGSQTDDYTFSWSDISNKGNLTANINVEIPEDELRPLFPDDNALLMIPQRDNQEVIMNITYTLYDANAQAEELTLTAQTPIGGWESGKEYNYSITITEITEDLLITVSVKDWQTPVASDLTVPES